MANCKFSVIIPTRNRHTYFVDAVGSILEQTYQDWELIVSDNSDENEAALNRAFIDQLGDPRIKYRRPQSVLNMVDHWEWALSHATGEYIGVVTDRMALRLFALSAIAKAAQSEPNAVCYQSQNVVELPNYRGLKFIERAPTTRINSSVEKLAQFASGTMVKDTPRLLNSFVRAEIVREMRKNSSTLLGGIAPDYFFTFRFLGYFDEFVSIEYPLLIVQGEARSNGRALATGRANRESQDFVARILSEQADLLQFGPIPGDIWILNAAILREYDLVSRDFNGRFPEIDPPSFYRGAIAYARNQSKSGLLSQQARDILQAYAESHSLAPVQLPENRRPSAIRASIRALRGENSDLPLRSHAIAIRRGVEKLTLALGLGKRISAPNLIEVLRADKSMYVSKIANQASR